MDRQRASGLDIDRLLFERAKPEASFCSVSLRIVPLQQRNPEADRPYYSTIHEST